jgi:hypothetical protein
MVIHNPGHYRRRASSARFTVKHRRNEMRKRRRVRKGSYRALVKRLGVKKASCLWRKSKRKGSRRRRRNSWKGHRKAHARAARKGWRSRRRGRKSRGRRRSRKSRSKYCRNKTRKGSYRALVRKLGVKKAVKVWRKRKRRCK